MPLAGPAPDAPVATLWVALTALFHGKPATRAGNPGFARGSKPVAEVYSAARAVEWLIRQPVLTLVAFQAHQAAVGLRIQHGGADAVKQRADFLVRKLGVGHGAVQSHHPGRMAKLVLPQWVCATR